MENAIGPSSKTKISHALFVYMSENLDFLRAHPKFGFTVYNKLFELRTQCADHIKDGDLSQEECAWIPSIYEKLFGVGMPAEDKSATSSHTKYDDMMRLFSGLGGESASEDADIKVTPTISIEISVGGVAREATADVDVTLQDTPAWMKKKKSDQTKIRIAHVRFFKVRDDLQGKGKCKDLFSKVLKQLERMDVEMVSLNVYSSRSVMACKCYINAAKAVEWHAVDAKYASVEGCKQGTSLLFVRTASPELTQRVNKLRKASENLGDAKLLEHVLRNYRSDD